MEIKKKLNRKIETSFFMNLRSAFLFLLRCTIYIFFYKLRFIPKLKLASFINNCPRIQICINEFSYKMQLDLRDKGLSSELYIFKIREFPNEFFFIKFLKKHGRKIETIIDIGANIGYYVLLENSIYFNFFKKNIKIFAVEPLEENSFLLKKNMILNNIKTVKLVKAAMGEKNQLATLIVSNKRNLCQIENTPGEKIKYSEKRKVRMHTLNFLFSKYNIPKRNLLFRFDIEGYEHNLIKGNLKILKEVKDCFIIMEFHPHLLKKEKTIDLLKKIKKLGFKMDSIISCYPRYFLPFPKIIRKQLKKLWLWEKNGSNLGIMEEFKNIDQLIKEYENEKSALYSYHHLHLYLKK